MVLRGRVLVIDAVDVLDQPHAVRVEPVGEEDGAEIGAASAERHHAVLGMVGDEAGHDHDSLRSILAHTAAASSSHQVGIERRAFRH